MRILVAEDEQTVARNIARSLQSIGYVPDVVSDGEEAWFKGSTETYAAVVLDLGLPKLDGISILKRWRAEGIVTPVLILSARGSWGERVEGIDSGADDYLPKPFQMQELISRLRALMRRSGGHAQSMINSGPVQIDMRSRLITVNGTLANLTPLEFRLVHYLAMQSGRVVTQAELADTLYAHDHERDANAIEAVVSRLRRKLGSDVIQNKRGFGYFISSNTPT
jgi:two-component system, OmpR family, response regulator